LKFENQIKTFGKRWLLHHTAS